jgi:hypothetical protein
MGSSGSASADADGVPLLFVASEAVAKTGRSPGCFFKTKREKAKIPPPRTRAITKRTIKVGRWRDKWKKNPRRFRLFLKFKLLIKSPGHISDNHIACGIAEIPLSLYSIA